LVVDADTAITIDGNVSESRLIAEALASYVRDATGRRPRIASTADRPAIALTRSGGLRREEYRLEIDEGGARLEAGTGAGLFRGAQTLRQLVLQSDARTPLPVVHIVDYPRFGWRGAMLDVARHFMPVEAVKRYIDLLTLYKINVLHLHLSDDQGWRIYVEAWPRLAEHGGGRYFTKADYAEIVRYAADRYISVVPEIDVPAHVGAVLASYPELICKHGPPLRSRGASLCVHNEATYKFFDDVVREISELTPGDNFHIGGDEAFEVSKDDYVHFVSRARLIVRGREKKVVGWHEIARANLGPDDVVQYWGNSRTGSGADLARTAVRRGAKLVLSPSDRVYLDMKYNRSTPLGLSWAGFVGVERAYDWDPAALIDGVVEDDVLGVEAPLWTETIRDIRGAEFMSFPRLAGAAEIGWSPSDRSWAEYRSRLGAHGRMWAAMGVNFYPSPEVDWERP
jgi:hexosaminidase